MNKSYSKKLRDPRWQKMRLKVLERDEWMCQVCGDDKSTLVVHHRYYIRGKEPWEYPLDALLTLCEECHQAETEDMPGAISLLNHTMKAVFTSADIVMIAKALGELGADVLWDLGISTLLEFLDPEKFNEKIEEHVKSTIEKYKMKTKGE